MKSAELDETWEVQLDLEADPEGGIWLKDKYHRHLYHIDHDAALKLADQIQAWDVKSQTKPTTYGFPDSVYNLKDEEGQLVSDEVVESSRD